MWLISRDIFKYCTFCSSAEHVGTIWPKHIGNCWESPFIDYLLESRIITCPILKSFSRFIGNHAHIPKQSQIYSQIHMNLRSEGFRELFWSRYGDTTHFNNKEQTKINVWDLNKTYSFQYLIWSPDSNFGFLT